MKLVLLSVAFVLAASVLDYASRTQGTEERSSLQPERGDSADLDSLPENPLIDYRGFVELTLDVQAVREARRVPIDKFLELAKRPNTIILDARSKGNFDRIHLAGAVHLNFSDFSAQKLAEVIPDKTTQILIYCNNNFIIDEGDQDDDKLEGARQALLTKSRPLALNIPTFINLYGYGYENIYELADALPLDDARLIFAGSEAMAIGQPGSQVPHRNVGD